MSKSFSARLAFRAMWNRLMWHKPKFTTAIFELQVLQTALAGHSPFVHKISSVHVLCDSCYRALRANVQTKKKDEKQHGSTGFKFLAQHFAAGCQKKRIALGLAASKAS